jgi:hypothetical protein
MGVLKMKKLIQIDQTKKYYESLSKSAVRIGGGWVNMMTESYKEPSRAGTPKGKPIGLSSKKYRAALFMILYDGRNLKEIALLGKVSPGLLRLWRTETAFLEVAGGACQLFAAVLVNTMDAWICENAKKIGDKYIEETIGKKLEGAAILTFSDFPYEYDPKEPLSRIGPLVDMLPFFNKHIFPVVAMWLENRLKENSLLHSFLAMRIHEGTPKEKKDLRKWEIKRLEITKSYVDFSLQLLARPSNDMEEEKKAMAITIRDRIFGVLDNLAGG